MRARRRVTIRTQVMMPLDIDGFVTDARMTTFTGLADRREHFALTLGPDLRTSTLNTEAIPLVRVHSECLTGDVFGSQRCDCGPQLRESIQRLAAEGGHLLYLRQEGRGIGLYNKINAYSLQDRGLDAYQANTALGFARDERDYTVAAQMLAALNVDVIDLFTNNADKSKQLHDAGVVIRNLVPTGLHLANRHYLEAKARHESDRAQMLGTPRPEIADA